MSRAGGRDRQTGRTAQRGARQLLARIRADAAVLLVVVGVMVAGTAAVAALPRALAWLGAESLAGELAETVVSRRAIRVEALARVPRGADDDPLAGLRQRGWDELEGATPALLDTLEPPQMVVDLPRLQLESLAGDDPADANQRLLTLRVQDGLDGHVRVVEGRLPRGEAGRLDAEHGGRDLPLHEVALTAATATALDLAVGDRVRAVPDAQDAVSRGFATTGLGPVAIEVVGLIDLTSPTEDTWFADPRLHRPAMQDGPATTFFAFGYVPVEAIGGLPGADQGVWGLVSWRFLIDPDAITTATASEIRGEVRRLEARTDTVASGTTAAVRTDLGALLDREEARREAAATTLTVTGLAVSALAILLAALTARLVVLRRRQAMVLQRSRGASPSRLVAGQAGEALLLIVPAGLAGWALATVAIPGSNLPAGSVLAAAGLVIVVWLLFVAGVGVEARRDLAELRTSPDDAEAPGTIARVLEVLGVAAAIVSVVVLRQRGLDGGPGRDLLSAAAPLLVAVAAGILAARLVPVLARWTARRAANGRRLAATVGLARGGRGGGLRVGVLAMVFTMVTGVAAVSIHASVASAQDRVAWEQVGVPVRVTAAQGTTLDRDILTRLPDDVAAVPGHRTRTTVRDGGRSRQVDVLVTDPAALEELVSGLPVSFSIPDELVGHPTAPGEPVPVIASAQGFVREPTTVGDTFNLLLGPRTVEVEVVAVHDRLPAVSPDGAPWLLVPTDPVEQVLGRPLAWTELAVRPASGTGAAGVAAIQAADPAAVVTGRDQVLERQRAQPLARGVALGFQAVAWLSIAAAAIAVAAVSVLTGRDRARDLALLAAVGVPRRQLRAASLFELLPPLTVGIAAGFGVAAGLAPLLNTSLELSPFVDNRPVPISLNLLPALAVAAIVFAATVTVASAATWRAMRSSPAAILREGDTT